MDFFSKNIQSFPCVFNSNEFINMREKVIHPQRNILKTYFTINKTLLNCNL